jgi:hypothetical protein
VILPIIAVLDDSTVLVFDSADEVLGPLETIDIESDEYTFYDSRGHLLKYEVVWEATGRIKRFLWLKLYEEKREIVRFCDYEPPLDHSFQMRKSLEDWLLLPVFKIPAEWTRSASTEELIAKIRQLSR